MFILSHYLLLENDFFAVLSQGSLSNISRLDIICYNNHMLLLIHKTQRSILALTILLSAIATKVAFADCSTTTITLFNPFDPNCSGGVTISTVAGYFSTFLLAIAAPLCGIMVVWGGFQMITAAGNPEKFTTGRKTLQYAAIGFVIVILASGASLLIKNIFNGS